ncbi:Uncharacterised protein [Vibrio cholerae]|nr:Uncharacterised protein [Vibrio cholerae]CSD10385.1 Uncharacterised protein [Vibrio cholerae]
MSAAFPQALPPQPVQRAQCLPPPMKHLTIRLLMRRPSERSPSIHLVLFHLQWQPSLRRQHQGQHW